MALDSEGPKRPAHSTANHKVLVHKEKKFAVFRSKIYKGKNAARGKEKQLVENFFERSIDRSIQTIDIIHNASSIRKG